MPAAAVAVDALHTAGSPQSAVWLCDCTGQELGFSSAGNDKRVFVRVRRWRGRVVANYRSAGSL